MLNVWRKILNVVINDADFTMNLSFLMAVLSQLPLQLQQLPLLPPLQRLLRLRLQPQLPRNLKRRATKEIRRRATRADLDVILMLMSDMTVRTLPLEQSKSQPVSQNGLTGT